MTIGVAAPYFGIWYTGKILAGIERVLSESGYDLVVYAADPPDNRDRFLDRAASLQTRIDGLILVDFFPDDEQVERMLDARLEIVAIGEYLDPFSSLAVDNEAAAFEAVSHLIDLGHRRVAIFGTEDIHKIQSPVLTPHRAGYARALGAAGIDVSHALDIDCALSVAGGAAGFDRFLELEDPPTAIFCLSDESAMGAMGRARSLGIAIPDQVSILGFDDHDLAESLGLTTMRQPVREIGERGARLLLDMIGHTNAPVEHLVVAVDLIVRTSTAAPAPLTRLRPSRHSARAYLYKRLHLDRATDRRDG